MSNEIRLIAGVYQDGGSFYLGNDDGHDLQLAYYPDTVRDDSDMAGAYAARLAFVRDYPEYGFVVLPEAANWFTGSNGNLFCDAGGFRYCIARQTYPPSATYDYSVARNGQLIARTPSFADAKRIVQLDSLKAEEGDA